MTEWIKEELAKIEKSEEIQIAAIRSDGTLRNPVTIWIVRLGDELYVRSVNGRNSAWFSGVLVKHAGHIWAGGIEKEVTFVEETDSALNDKIDTLYKTKYHRYAASIINHINSPNARSATLKLVIRE
ncbi:MAG: DUF2255 family protein [Anaerolineaceae bacterium]